MEQEKVFQDRHVMREIDRALDGTPEDHKMCLKVTGDEGASRWLSVTPEQVRAIRALLTSGELGGA